MYLSIPPEGAVAGLGAVCVVPSSVAAQTLRCDTEDLAAIAVAIGSVVTRTDAHDAIKAASQLAVKWLLTAAAALKRPRPKGVAGEPMRLKFREALGTNLEFVPTWRPRGETWDRGDIVRARLALRRQDSRERLHTEWAKELNHVRCHFFASRSRHGWLNFTAHSYRIRLLRATELPVHDRGRLTRFDVINGVGVNYMASRSLSLSI
jgi:hypothetical protein